MQKLLIYGASGLGREILDMINDIYHNDDKYEMCGFIDDGMRPGTIINDLPVLGGLSYLENSASSYSIVFAVADTKTKENLYNKIKKMGGRFSFPVIIHPSSSVSQRARLGEGTVISRYCWVTADTQLGKFVFLNTKCDIGHDSIIGDFCSLMPSVNVSGNVSVGQRTLIGVQSAILQGIKIGSDVTVGMGSKVMTDVPDNCTVMGYPAKIIARHEPKE